MRPVPRQRSCPDPAGKESPSCRRRPKPSWAARVRRVGGSVRSGRAVSWPAVPSPARRAPSPGCAHALSASDAQKAASRSSRCRVRADARSPRSTAAATATAWGMSQYGARGRALAGQAAPTILAHYYQGNTSLAVSLAPVRPSGSWSWADRHAEPQPQPIVPPTVAERRSAWTESPGHSRSAPGRRSGARATASGSGNLDRRQGPLSRPPRTADLRLRGRCRPRTSIQFD